MLTLRLLRARCVAGALSVLLVSLALLSPATIVKAQSRLDDYPTKPVKIVVSFTAGGTTDVIARSVGQLLSEKFKQSFIVENKPGSGGNIGNEYVARSAADGYTLTIASVGPIAVNPTLFKNLRYNPLTELTPVILIADVPNVLLVSPKLPVHSFKEFIAYAKAANGKINYSSTGVGTSSHLSSVMLMDLLGVDAQHIPYKGAEALNDLIAGRIDFMFATIPSVIGQIKAGKLNPLVVSSLNRSRSLPDVPTVAENGYPGFSSGSWFGMLAPTGTPPEIITKLNQSVNEVMVGLEERFVSEGADPVGKSPEFFKAFIQAEYVKWKAVVESSGASEK
ncbi:tripartite-type tricarboxylate transporter receptor subunit TctC [Jezberella montanilacus]|uniref:Tripartite-type tricarboxylate transporter receptor subunit TctC n=1 Tax=Jezberella montanilacus TaxID=323426 RepID=A0A2T0XHM3_9BURK|nr:tripartite tricarboxylate transporter substrate binding protein [Jezberella montanilacus]PRY98436.1 tripartite-type tricarboxylate transporter receptor subunit TctC [Jezberella montanilacus]